MYHQVGNFKKIRSHRATFCKYSRFRVQMAYFKAMGYRVMGLSEGFRRLQEGSLPRKAIVLTFDDGYADFYYLVAPLLRRYGFGATVFPVADLIGQKAYWLKEYGYPEAPLLTKEMIIELRDEGFEFGSHGLSHRRLSELDREALEAELKHSKAVLEEILQKKVSCFCYPYGDYNSSVQEATEAAGYRAAVTCERGKATARTDPYRLPRVAVSFGDSLAGLLWKIHLKAKPFVHDET